jgi:hypothetical protein
MVSAYAIDAAWNAGRIANAQVVLDREAFARFVRERGDSPFGDPARAADLYLACACLQKIPQAVEAARSFGAGSPRLFRRA